MLIETMTFRLADGVSEAQFLEADGRAYAAGASGAVGSPFLRRTTARGDDGRWLVVTLWGDEAVALPGLDGVVTDVAVERWHTLD